MIIKKRNSVRIYWEFFKKFACLIYGLSSLTNSVDRFTESRNEVLARLHNLRSMSCTVAAKYKKVACAKELVKLLDDVLGDVDLLLKNGASEDELKSCRDGLTYIGDGFLDIWIIEYDDKQKKLRGPISSSPSSPSP